MIWRRNSARRSSPRPRDRLPGRQLCLGRLASGDAGITARPRRIESARTPDESVRYREQISLGFPLEHAPDESLVLDIQSALWSAGLVRAAGSLDLLIAGYAIVNDVVVLTADRDFDHIAKVADLRHEYVAPSL